MIKKLKIINKKISQVPKADKKPWSQSYGKRKESMVGMILKKDSF